MPTPPPQSISQKGIGDLFYETRVLMGRGFTLARFATEVLGGTVDPVMLGYIEKGQRFPNDALVRRLATAREEDPRRLLAILARDRMLKTIGKELVKVLEAPAAVGGVEDAEVAVRISVAIAALPDDETWIDLAAWREQYSAPPKRQKNAGPLDSATVTQVRDVLLEQGLIEIDGARVRRSGRHYSPVTTDERSALALEYCVLFLKGLLDRLAFPDEEKGTYMRNHYMNIDRARVPEFQEALDQALRGLAEQYASDPSKETEFLNILTTATTF
jgi:hypothetical protein